LIAPVALTLHSPQCYFNICACSQSCSVVEDIFLKNTVINSIYCLRP